MKTKALMMLVFVAITTLLVPTVFAGPVNNNNATYISVYATNGSQDDATGDYTLGGGKFYIKPPAGEVWYISRLIGSIEDTGGMDSGAYGNNINLVYGIWVYTNISGTVRDLTGGEPVLTNADWARYCHDVTLHAFGIGDDTISFRWTFEKSGTYLVLDGDKGDEIYLIMNESFTGLTDHHFLFQGYKYQVGGEDMSWTIAIMIGLLSFTALMFILAFKIDSEHSPLKLLYYFLGLFSIGGVLHVSSKIIQGVASTQTDIISYIDKIFGVWTYVMYFIMVYYFIVYFVFGLVLKRMGNKKRKDENFEI